jgi:hypothetical protein
VKQCNPARIYSPAGLTVPDPGEVAAVLLESTVQLALHLALDVPDLADLVAEAGGAAHRAARNVSTLAEN